MRDPIRQQLAAQLLNDPSRDAYGTFFGLAMWFMSGGDDIAQVIAFAEPRFEETTADALIAHLESHEFLPRIRDFVLPKVAVAMWDLLSAETINRLLGRMLPTAGPVPIDQEVRHFWGRTGLVVPDVWAEHVSRLERPQQAALLEALPPAVIDSIPRRVIWQLAEAAVEAGDELPPAARATRLLLQRALGQSVSLPDDSWGARVSADIGLRVPEALSTTAYSNAERTLREARRSETQSALEGSMGFGGRSTAADLSIVAEARGRMDDETTLELVVEATDERLPADFRLDSLLALARAANADLIAPDLPRIDDPAQRQPFFFFQNVSIDLLEAARLAVHAKRLSAKEQVAVLTLSRHPDVRVRQIACSTAGIFLRQATSPSVESALLAGLFDPDESVLTSALGGLAQARLTETSDDAIAQRLLKLYQGYGRDVRAAAVRAAKSRLRTNDDPRLRPIVETAALDRSWLVRDAATEVDEDA